MNTSTTLRPSENSSSHIHPTATVAMIVAAIAAVVLVLSAVSVLSSGESTGQATTMPGQVDICSSTRQGVWFPIQVEQEFKAQGEEQAAP